MARLRHLPPRAALWAALLIAPSIPGCGDDSSVTGPSVNVIWTRLTPSQTAGADFPDWRGDSIAFQLPVGKLDRIAIAAEDGSAIEIQPESGADQDRAPRWVRGGLLVYSSDVAGSEDLWYRDLDANATRRLTADPGSEWSPAPRPGSGGLVYVEGLTPGQGRLVLIPDTAAAPLGHLYLTPASLAAAEPDFSPGGDQICFSVTRPDGAVEIWRLSLTDTLAIQLTAAPPVLPPSDPQIDRSPRWSPDGAEILMASNRGGRWGVWTVSPAGEAQGLRLIDYDDAGGETSHPCWSPDGRRILLSTDRGGFRALWSLSNFTP